MTIISLGFSGVVRLDLLEPSDLTPFRTPLLRVHREGATAKESDEGPGFLARLDRDAARAGFRCVVARLIESGRLAGFAYGMTTYSLPQAHPGPRPPSGLAALSPLTIRGAFQLADLVVLPAARGQGIGRALHDALLDGLPHHLAWLVAPPAAEAVLCRWGWRVCRRLPATGTDSARSLLNLDLPSRAEAKGEESTSDDEAPAAAHHAGPRLTQRRQSCVYPPRA